MSIKILNIETGKSENLKLSDSLIGLKVNNKLLKYVIDWQLNRSKKRVAKTKQRNEIIGSTCEAMPNWFNFSASANASCFGRVIKII